IAFTVYVASAFVAGTSIFTMLFPAMPESTAMILFALIIVGYTFLGGFRAVCWTDFFQGILMLAALIAVPILVVATTHLDTASLSQVIIGSDGTEYAFTSNLFSATWQEVVSGLAWGLGYFGMPHILVRFMAIEKPSMIKKSATVAIIWVVISLGAAIVMAYLGRMVVGAELLAAGNQKLVFVALARQYFPAFISGILLAAIIAASMSTADSQLLVASSSFTNDIYKQVIRKDADNKELLWVGRVLGLSVAVIAFFIANSRGSGAQAIMEMVENAWGLFGAAFGPVILLSLFWKRFNHAGAIAGIAAGAVVDLVWYNLLTDVTGVYEILPGFVAGLICAVIVTLLTKAPEQKVVDLFEKATAKDFDE
ncbi:MAG: sodium/proline symporter, partial [Clostridia bacterium]|nr:sodium/proline symporter [Clostridia bacterium]